MSAFKNISSFNFRDVERKSLDETSCELLAKAIMETLGSEEIRYMCSLAESLYNDSTGKVYFMEEHGYNGYVKYSSLSGFEIFVENMFEKDAAEKMLIINTALMNILF